ncbi:hypothetical protein MCOR27_009921 [Pyricularia oryzae]|uniref:DUF3835 domain-containing protein n=2 Tax=Pyricularia TaxID=48558 RepID=A0ABQ8NBP3_PYRGI|nr:hypothetical protein MCOR02_009072 [Pyricularia oryzae]KAI6294505.1 hypothetical protein MCOR33_008383 [Pyricularia grisea]KAI6261085.1 hypothetical protein MCOR19_002627 [Pyricularia oryzae]KAI6269002.1 hypothetical protein MCOR27_009921 [Pyricularia oryzae]KAI6277008.1 hypothetical protein MCOR26_005363 [Pyricularia oryzae]
MAPAPATEPAQGTTATVQEIERQRHALQDNTTKLRALLQEWRLWDVEYEALKEEVEEARGRADLVRIRRNFEGRLVNAKEVSDIFTGSNKADSDAIKSADQIINQLDRRLDYVQRNIESLEKQVKKAEDRAAAAEEAAAGPGNGGASGTGEDGLPIMDIVEELDDDDNVLSFRVQRPGETEAKVSEVLKKAGVELKQDDDVESSDDEGDVPAKKRIEESAEKLPSPNAQSSTASPASKPDPIIKSQAKPTTPTQDVPAAGKKGVSFSEDTKPAADGDINGATNPMQTKTQKKIEEIMRQAREQEQMATNPPVIPDDESDDDAKLRRDMLAYSMNEIGPVVAELELEEAYSDEDEEDGMEDYGLYDDDDEDAYDDDDYDDDEDEEEDERGRSKRSALSPAYRKRMLELEKRLGVGRQSVGKQSTVVATADEPEDEEGEKIDYDEPRLGRIAIRSNPTTTTTTTTPAIRPTPNPPTVSAMKSPTTAAATSTAKKGVRFAQEVDIAEEPAGAPLADPHGPVEPKVEPVSDIVERVPVGPKQAPTRFLDTMEPNIAPSGPEGRTLADAVMEREPVTKPREPSEFDADLLHQEAAVEYHRLRNKMIQREGGFAKEKESAIEPLDESEGGPKKMSRFKAARLGRV